MPLRFLPSKSCKETYTTKSDVFNHAKPLKQEDYYVHSNGSLKASLDVSERINERNNDAFEAVLLKGIHTPR